jgi:hypothetical protein
MISQQSELGQKTDDLNILAQLSPPKIENPGEIHELKKFMDTQRKQVEEHEAEMIAEANLKKKKSSYMVGA